MTLSNIVLPGYFFISQPSLTSAGGFDFFCDLNEAKFNIRTDISITTNNFEAMWIEVHNDFSRDMICGVLYQHPNSNVQNFIDYLSTTTDKIQRDNKHFKCLLSLWIIIVQLLSSKK